MASKTLTFTLIGKDGSASKAIQGVGRSAQNLTKVFAGVGAAIAGAFAVARIVNFAKATVTEFAAAEKAQQELSFAFERFPALVGGNIQALRDLNTELMKKTRFDDDALAAGQAVLAQYNLTQAQLEQITPLLADYAARTGKDIPDAATDLGKAILGQGRALKNIGINFVNTGTAAGNFEQIIAGLSAQVGGFAEKEGQTFLGSLERLKNGVGEIKEAIGSAFAPSIVYLADAVQLNLLPALQTLVDKVGPRVTAFLSGGAETIGKFADAVGDAVSAADPKPIEAFFDALAKDVPAVAVLKTIFDTLAPVMPVLAESLGELGKVLTSEGVLDAISQLVTELLPPLAELLIAIAPLIPPIADILSTVLVPALLLVAGNVGAVTTALDLLAGNISIDEFMKSMEALPIIGDVFKFIGERVFATMNMISSAINGLIGAIEGAVNGVRFLMGMGAIKLPRLALVLGVSWGNDAGPGHSGSGSVHVPKMADGGIVPARRGGMRAIVGEGLYDEAVVPLSPRNLAAMSGGGGGVTVLVTVPGGFVGDERKLSQVVTAAIKNGIKRGDISRGWAGQTA